MDNPISQDHFPVRITIIEAGIIGLMLCDTFGKPDGD